LLLYFIEFLLKSWGFVCPFKRFDRSYRIVYNKEISLNCFELKIDIGWDVARHCSPGQFFMIRVPGVFLSRPMSICDVEDGFLIFLYKVVGSGTDILSKIRSGEIQLLGPLGKGYNLERYKNLNHVLVAGGTGIASVHFLAVRLRRQGILYYGARSKRDLLCLDSFRKLGWRVVISTEDGSKGFKGYITDSLSNKLKNTDVIFACGPTPMLKKILQIIRKINAKGFISLEEKMACGIGSCQGCAIKINGQIKMTCKDGPVFKIEDVEL
jgi:dihydroorotate dehydrogenase electron transfer subunit